MKLLFTTLTTEDLGLLTRSLPIAGELAERGHEVSFCNPARAPSRLIAQAGFKNLLPKHPLFYLMAGGLDLRGFYRQFRSDRMKREFGSRFTVLIQLLRAAPTRLPPITPDVWNMDHFAAVIGMLVVRGSEPRQAGGVGVFGESSLSADQHADGFGGDSARLCRCPGG